MNNVNMSDIAYKIHFIYKDECEKNVAAMVIFYNNGKYFFDEKHENEMSNDEVEALLLRGALVYKDDEYAKPSSFNNSNISFGTKNTIALGNYIIQFNEKEDTLDFLYNGVIDEPIIVNNYVREGLSMYIDANDVATYGSIRDIAGNRTITNHGVTITSDNNYLNFVAGESDYLDTDLVPNLTTWSAELYFYFTKMPTSSANVFTWGENPNQIRVAYSGSKKIFAIQCNSGTNYKITDSANILTPHHLILTMNNGTITSYYDGVKSIITSGAAVQTSPQTLTLKIGGNYSATTNFADMNLRMFRFYDGKVLTDEEALQNYNYELKNNYVREGLSMYIDANDVATRGSVRDITGNQTIANHGVSTTLDNGCLNFVKSESDYIDCGFKPNLTQWSAEAYFYYSSKENAGALLSWGVSGNRTTISVWDSFMIAIRDDVSHTIMSTAPTSLTHFVLTYNNGTIIAYVNGEKSQIATNANVMSSQAGNLMIGTKYSASADFAGMHLKSLRFYDGKVLTDEEALQNYNYEINRNDGIINPTWIDNRNINIQGVENDDTSAMVTDYLTKEDGYNYTVNLTSVSSVKIYFFNSSKTFISRTENLTVNSTDTLIEFPENTVYFRIKSDKGTATVANANDYIILKKVAK